MLPVNASPSDDSEEWVRREPDRWSPFLVAGILYAARRSHFSHLDFPFTFIILFSVSSLFLFPFFHLKFSLQFLRLRNQFPPALHGGTWFWSLAVPPLRKGWTWNNHNKLNHENVYGFEPNKLDTNYSVRVCAIQSSAFCSVWTSLMWSWLS